MQVSCELLLEISKDLAMNFRVSKKICHLILIFYSIFNVNQNIEQIILTLSAAIFLMLWWKQALQYPSLHNSEF